MHEYKHIFGPVPSRRFGRSLGIDLTPFKTCDFDCVFCQLGSTAHTTAERKEYVPTEDVIAELREWLDKGGEADVVTLAGSGEPTLHSGFGRVLDFIKSECDIPAVILTNGSLLHLPEVRADAAKAAIVKASLSAWDQESFRRVNRPNPSLRFDDIVSGLKAFRKDYSGELRLEVFLVPGINSDPGQVARIAALADEIKPDLVQLNTAVRPPAEDVRAVTPEEMERLAGLFRQKTEAIADFKSKLSSEVEANEETILAMLKRRPCTAAHIAEVFKMHPNEVAKYTGKLVSQGVVKQVEKNSEIYFSGG